ncbi:Ribosomal protein S18 acetylase RimI [Amphibacillus marinus]|uniref:Ribosomal protein S18 acetylase RimI n=1 Tax=Amphibacillus marinus TaxID=872970 RepID=A0A1H8T9F9_9BACI|nr:GNAT family N-acetyltransferase [Amphibacillus marinus]SEO87769.1 Ribosomal protein S18 acetylase RimI [Amphibacillus marinus]
MEIRQLKSNDAESYLAIRLEALQNSHEAFATSYGEEKNQTENSYHDRLSSETTFTFGAFIDKQLVGVITLVRETLVKLSHRANLVAMYIKPEARGKGIGKLLVNSAIGQAAQLDGLEQIYLSVVTTNQSAKQLYLATGFEVVGKQLRALKWQDRYYDEEQMVYYLK